MKLSRMMETLTILLSQKSVTAAELARRFGVSQRTIYRDVDLLSSSGVPVYTTQGAGGGISLQENYTLDRALLSEEDKRSILFALRTLQATKYPEIDAVLEKLGGLFQSGVSDWIDVDFSPWGANPNAGNKLLELKQAILQSRVLEIIYINAQNQSGCRKIEPLRLIYKSQAWYLWAWCLQQEAFRLFRVSRIQGLTVTEESFDRNRLRQADEAAEAPAPPPSRPMVHLVLQFSSQAGYRLYDDYGMERLQSNGDGTYTVTADYPEDEWVYGYLLSFGDSVKVLQPERIRKILLERAQKIVAAYAEI